MKLSILPSVPLALAVALAATSAQAPPKTPGPYKGPTNFSSSGFVSTKDALVISGGVSRGPGDKSIPLGIFASLNLSAPWPTSQPLWTKLPTPTNVTNPASGPIGLDKDGAKVYFFGAKSRQAFNLKSGKYEPAVNYAATPFHSELHTVTDTTSGLIYGLLPTPLNGSVAVNMVSFDPATGKVATRGLVPSGIEVDARGVYSQYTRSLYYFMSDGINHSVLYSFNIETGNWAEVTTSGSMPRARLGACFTGSDSLVTHPGKTILVLAGGRLFGEPPGSPAPATTEQLYQRNLVVNDVSVFDVSTSEWSYVQGMPTGYYNGVCALTGRSLVMYGGYGNFTTGPYRYDPIPNNKANVYNLMTNHWETTYDPTAPLPASPAPPSSTATTPVAPSVKVAGAHAEKIASVAGALTAAVAAIAMANML